MVFNIISISKIGIKSLQTAQLQTSWSVGPMGPIVSIPAHHWNFPIQSLIV